MSRWFQGEGGGGGFKEDGTHRRHPKNLTKIRLMFYSDGQKKSLGYLVR
jgi:hypothetical protein